MLTVKNKPETAATTKSMDNAQLPEPLEDLFEKDSTLALAYQLHSTLDLQNILNHFADAIFKQFPIQSLHYQYLPFPFIFNVGQPQEHQIQYDLTFDKQSLGHLSCTCHHPLNEKNLQKFEQTLCLLVRPLHHAIKHQVALQAALKDPLTGAGNRAALSDTLTREIELAKRHNATFSILLLDVDFFKTINDQHGHCVGDAVLKELVQILFQQIRCSDLLFRLGGEEFLMLLNKTDPDGAINLADRIRKQVANSLGKITGLDLTITVSIGIASYLNGDSETSLIERADEAMYRAKQQGRNRVSL